MIRCRLLMLCGLIFTSAATHADETLPVELDQRTWLRFHDIRYIASYAPQQARFQAQRNLIWLYLGRQDYQAAKDALQGWIGIDGWCGLSWEAHMEKRQTLIYFCRLHQGEHVQVAAELTAMLRQQYLPYPYATILFQLYHEAQQDDELINWVTITKSEKVHSVSVLLQVQRLRQQRDYSALIDLCRTNSAEIENRLYYNHPQRLAASALAECLEPDLASLHKWLGENPYLRGWLLLSLGEHRSPAALQLLSRSEVLPEDLPNLTYALSLHGANGKQALETMALQKTPRGTAAQARLQKMADPDPLDRPWPKPKPGSLPLP